MLGLPRSRRVENNLLTFIKAGVFFTYPQPYLVELANFLGVHHIKPAYVRHIRTQGRLESRSDRQDRSKSCFPLTLFFLILGLGACFGVETGYAINLARYFGPGLLSYILGYGPEVWTAGNYYFWVPIIASFLECIFGGFLYNAFIYTGPESPIKSPWMGLKRLVRPELPRRKRAKSAVGLFS